jgi:hypothetical protein
MKSTQKITLLVLALLGLVYFSLFLWPNSLGAKSEGMLVATSVDEPITYPYVVRMVTPPSDYKDLFIRWVIYGDYHYGYPFYFLSAVTLLPVVWLNGAHFTDFTQLNLLLLRQVISVLPMIAAAGLITYAQTRFLSVWKSVLLFVLILSMRGVVRSDLQWWHPDALSVLAVVLTLFLLDRDQLRFGRNFLLAAAACAVAIGIKFAGVFFAPAIALYLLAGWIQKKINFSQLVTRALLFLAVMLAVLVLTNPFLFFASARERLIKIQSDKTAELAQGSAKDDPYYAQVGPLYWAWTLKTWFGEPLALGFIALSLGVGCLRGPRQRLNRLILAWALPYTIYLFWFVAVKPDHYWLPILIPAFSAALSLWDALPDRFTRPWQANHPALTPAAALRAALLVGLLLLIGDNLLRPYSGNIARYQDALQVENYGS